MAGEVSKENKEKEEVGSSLGSFLIVFSDLL